MGLFASIQSVFNKNQASYNRLEEKTDWAVGQLSGEINELHQAVNGLGAKLKESTETLGAFAATLHKFDVHQKEASIQLEEISELLQDDGSEARLLIDALIAVAGQIEDFYLFAAEDLSSPLFAQAEMMWSAARKSLLETGLTMVSQEGIPFDSSLHLPVRTGADEGLPEGYVLKILASGYLYNGRVVRRASVIVNKKNQKQEGETL